MTEVQLTALGLTLEDWATFGPFEKLYLDLSELLLEIEDLRWIDLEAGQLEIPMESYPVLYPCALISFPRKSEFQDETQGHQQGQIVVRIRVGIDTGEDLQIVDGERAEDCGLAVKQLQLITKVHKLLHGFTTDYATPLRRSRMKMKKREDGIKVFDIRYTCMAKDDSAAKTYTIFTGADLEILKD